MKNIKYSLLFIALVLIISWIYTAFIFSKPERIDFFAFIMFLPATIGLILNTVRFKSFRKVMQPLTTRLNLKSVFFALFYPLVFIVGIAVLTWILDISEFNKETFTNLSFKMGFVNIIIAFFLMFGEEYGWRGFLLRDLAEKKNKIIATIIVGIVWALWHAPVVYGLAIHNNYNSPMLLTIVQMMAVFIFSMPFAYSYFISESIVPPMIFHFVWNVLNPIVLGNVYRNISGIMEGNILLINGEAIAGVLLGTLFFIWFIKKYQIKRE